MQTDTYKSASFQPWYRLAFWLALAYLVAFVFNGLFITVLPLPYSYQTLDLLNPTHSPSESWQMTGAPIHWLGTDRLGRDVLAHLLFGASTAFLVSFPATLLATILGTVAGSLAGFFGNNRLRVDRISLLYCLISGLILWFYGFYLPRYSIAEGFKLGFLIGWWRVVQSVGPLLLLLTLLFVALRRFLFKNSKSKTIRIPVDWLVLKAVEAMATVPTLVLVLFLSALTQTGIGVQVLFFSFTCWPESARFIRGEILAIRPLNYVESAEAMGLRSLLVLWRHVIPNAIPAVLHSVSFLLTTMIGLESVTSFFGIGLPPDVPSWGRLIADYRTTPDAWWLLVCPLLAILCTILSINTLVNKFVQGYRK